MTAADNKQLMQRIFAALAEGDGRPLVDAMAEDFRWIIAGASSWSRTYKGKETVRTELLAPLRARLAPPIRIVAQRIVAEDDMVVVEARGNNTTRAGERYENAYCFVFRLAEAKLAEVTEYMDTGLAERVLGERDDMSRPTNAVRRQE
jgi:uncharacterized protein